MTDKPKHTLGPWQRNGRDIFAEHTQIAVAFDKPNRGDAVANARLIRKAPDGYELAKMLVDAELDILALLNDLEGYQSGGDFASGAPSFERICKLAREIVRAVEEEG